MSSWLSNNRIKPKPILKPPKTLVVKHSSGFFSCCSFQLHMLVEFFNKHKEFPEILDATQQFEWYRPGTSESYFTQQPSVSTNNKKAVDFAHYYQYTDYKLLDYSALKPVIQRYFTLSDEITNLIKGIEDKYTLDYSNICVLFYRGNDKAIETSLCPYSDYIGRARAMLKANPKTRLLVQSDETEFIEAMETAFPSPQAFHFKNEIRHIPKSLTTVDKVCADVFKFSKLYLAITIIMSKAPHIICGTGNCSMWIALFRGNANGMQQFLKTSWV